MKIDGKYLSYILRHNPSAAYVELDSGGYVDVDRLIDGIKQAGKQTDVSDLERIVSTDSKRRFSFDEAHTKIRANYGHSVAVDLQMKEVVPPSLLYHGTARKYLDGIVAEGIKKQTRNYVHLSRDHETALSVGARHGEAIVLKIAAGRMHDDGYKFYLSESGVWLTEFVPCEYISFGTLDCIVPPFEMSSLREKRTGITGEIWVSDIGKRIPPSQYRIIYGNAGSAVYVYFTDIVPQAVGDCNSAALSELPKVIEWVKLNRDFLIKLYDWHDDYDIADFIRDMKPVKRNAV